MTNPSSFDPALVTGDAQVQLVASILFSFALVHSFMVKRFEEWAHHFPKGSIGENFFHLLSEVEVVMGIWAASLIGYISWRFGPMGGIAYLESIDFTDPAFVFVIMCMAATRPVIKFCEIMIRAVSRLLPFPRKMAFYFSTMVIGPIMGSFITGPAAITVTALILLEVFFKRGMSRNFMYATLSLLFVNVSVGGVLTHFASPPVLMVAGKWGWDSLYVFSHFGYKATFAVVVAALAVTLIFAKELKGELILNPDGKAEMRVPGWMMFVHAVFLFAVVWSARHMVFFMGTFLMFLGFVKVTREYQDSLKLRESLMVGFFLGGLVILGSLQTWWLEPVLARMNNLGLFAGATLLTAITDNAALTYLGSMVPGLPEVSKYYLVAGAVTGGGLTVLANSPNPAGYGILKDSFGEKGISPLVLLLVGIPATLLASLAFIFFPSL
jgi:hypothetical protein